MTMIIHQIHKGRCKKNVFFGTLSQTMGRWGSKVPNSLVKITIQSFLLQTSRNVPKHAICGWVGVQSPKQIHGILFKKFLIFSNKIKCSKQPKKQNNPNFHLLLLVESQTCAVGGWGPMFGTKSQKNRFFTPSFKFVS